MPSADDKRWHAPLKLNIYSHPVLNKIKNEGITASQAAAEYGLPVKTKCNWLRGKTLNVGSTPEPFRIKRQNKLLLELVGRLTMEKEQQTLKKN